jgi:hypothetical protein
MANEKTGQTFTPTGPRLPMPPATSTTPGDPPPPTMQEREDALASLTNALASGITEAVRLNSPPRQVTFGEYKSRNSKNPTGRTDQDRELSVLFFQNGDRIRERKLHDEELALIPQLRAGTFCDGLVLVQDFVKDGRRALNLSYKNKEIADRMALKGVVPRLVDMLRRCVHEAADPLPIVHASL